MKTLFTALARRMVVKIFAAVGLVVAAALILLARKQSADEVRSLTESLHQSAQQVADLVAGSVTYSMLQGDGIEVKKLIHGIKDRVPEAEIAVYDPMGAPVFGATAKAPARETLPRALAAVLTEPRRVEGDDGKVLRPLRNEPRCHSCHDKGPLRGVLELTPAVATLAERREEILTALVRDGFARVMTARQSEKLDGYFEELSLKAPALSSVTVYDRKGNLRFGSRVEDLPKDALAAALREGAVRSHATAGDVRFTLQPLPSDEQCIQCHKDGEPVRGALVLGFKPTEERQAELEEVVEASVRTIMMSSLGRMITGFLGVVATSGAASSVALYDDAGRTYFTSRPGAPAPIVADTLRTAKATVRLMGAGKDERIVVAQPLKNEPACMRCHGTSSALRGVVTVSLSTGATAAAREEAMSRTTLYTFAALAATLLVLYLVIQKLVVSPVKEIGDAAEAIGAGNLDVMVRSADPNSDEVRRLGSRINDMASGLRTKRVLERFVSRGTATAAVSAGQSAKHEALSRQGERLPMVVLFSDIRGFTKYSESVPAEEVVELLNQMLECQAEAVERHGGDVDKFVGDEVMALFDGEDAVERAARCAVEMVEATGRVEKARAIGIGIGVGIFMGDVIYGPIGSKSRMDFTVIGDVVNTAARLCSVAHSGQVLVGVDVARALAKVPDLRVTPLPPLAVKGKREPLEVAEVGRTG